MADETEQKETNIQSDIHDSIDSLIQAKSTTLLDNRDAIERRSIVHAFTNLRDTLTEEEQNDLGREEITNFGSTFRSAQVNIAPLESIVSGTDSLVETTVDLNDENRDHLLSVEIANEANDWFFTGNEKFHRFWRTAIGEGYLSGGGAAIFDDSEVGLFPRYNRHLYFPKGTPLDPDEMTYAYEKREMSMNDLEEIIAAAGDEDDDYVQVSQINAMIEEIGNQIEGSSARISSSDTAGVNLDSSSARDNCRSERITFEVWGYWEVRTYPQDHKTVKMRGQKYVSHVLFVDGATVAAKVEKGKMPGKPKDIKARAILAQEEVAFDDPREWLVMLIFDEEVGGEKTVDTLRGLAEAYYKPAVLIEELRNVEIEGAMQSARLTLQAREGADPDEVLDFELGRDLFAPDNVDVLQIPNTGNQVRPIVQDLMQTVSGITSTGHSNTGRGGELRQQALERQDNSQVIKTNRTIKGYMKIDEILDLIIGRGLTLDPDPGTEDYRLIKGFQENLDRKIADIYQLQDEQLTDDIEEGRTALKEAAELRRKIGERSYGKFKYLRVKARRNASGLDRPTEVENAQFILNLIETGRVPAQMVPALLERAIAYQTQNADIAQLVAGKPEPISTEQRERAANEFDIIRRRVAAGEVYPIGPRDIDEDHVDAHTLDLIAFVNSNGLRPWDQLTVAEFAGVIQHTGAHIERMRSRPESGGVAREKMIELQEIVKQAGGIIQVLEEQKAQQENGDLSPQDRLALAKEQKTYAEIEMLGRKFGVDLEDKRDTMRNRVVRAQQNQERQNLMTRQSLVKEIQQDRDYLLKKDQVAIQEKQLKLQS